MSSAYSIQPSRQYIIYALQVYFPVPSPTPAQGTSNRNCTSAALMASQSTHMHSALHSYVSTSSSTPPHSTSLTWLKLPSAKPLRRKAVILKAYVSVSQAVYMRTRVSQRAYTLQACHLQMLGKVVRLGCRRNFGKMDILLMTF